MNPTLITTMLKTLSDDDLFIALGHPKTAPDIVLAGCEKHSLACNCREGLFEKSLKTHRRVVDWSQKSQQEMEAEVGVTLSENSVTQIREVLRNILK